MLELELERRAQRCLADVLKEIARRSGGMAVDEDGLLLVSGTHPCPVLVNSALRTGALEAHEAVRRIAAFNAERGHYCETWVRDGADADLESALIAARMRVAVELSGMVLTRCPDLPVLPTGSELRQVEDTDGAQAFTNVVARGFRDEAPGLSELVRTLFLDPRMLIAPDTAAFVVWDRGQPVSAAMTMVKGEVAWIGWVGTCPEARGRGFGGLATAAAARAGFTLGAEFASLEATKMGEPVYRRLGFRELMRYRTYWPEAFTPEGWAANRPFPAARPTRL